jgi:tricorn protease interacting factor F2/3
MNILTAMGCLSNETVMREALAHVLDHVPQRNRHLPLVSCAANPEVQVFLWDWFVSNIDQLEMFHPILFERVIDALVPVCGLGREASVRAFFEDYLFRKKAGGATIRIALEFLTVNERMRG